MSVLLGKNGDSSKWEARYLLEELHPNENQTTRPDQLPKSSGTVKELVLEVGNQSGQEIQ